MSTRITDGVPFLKILPLVAAGILLEPALGLGWVMLSIVAALSIAASLVWRKRPAGGVAAAVAVVSAAMLMTNLRTIEDIAPKERPLLLTVELTDNPSETTGKRQRCHARLETFGRGSEEEWEPSGEGIIIYADSSFHLTSGERYSFVGTLYPLSRDDGKFGAYAELMHRRGFTSCCFVSACDVLEPLPTHRSGVRRFAQRLQMCAVERLERLGLPRDEAAIAEAMAFGWRGPLDKELKEEYARSGTAHLLAVSGLHVGIVVMLVNVLLYLLPAVGRRGHLWKNIVAVSVIWLYALLTGATPSVVRAAAMFTGLQIGLAYGGERSAGNILFAVASVMLLINPNYLYDISFQLSFIAVAGIAVGFPPLMRAIESRSKVLNMVWGLLIVGLCSSVATAPITAYCFGRLPLVGIVINPLVILTANAVVLLSLLWSIAPVGALNHIFGTLIGGAAEIQNDITGWTGAQPWASVEVSLPLWAVVVIYAAVVAAAIVINKSKNRKEQWKLKR